MDESRETRSMAEVVCKGILTPPLKSVAEVLCEAEAGSVAGPIL